MSQILVQGSPLLEGPSARVSWPDPSLADELTALHRELAEFRRAHGFGRAIAAPQIGIAKRVIAMNLGATPFTVINPKITWRSDEMLEVWDDCMTVPNHVVRVRRHRSISLLYTDEHGRERRWQRLAFDMSELVQHEVDHLDGVLMTGRAMDADSVRPISEHGALVGTARPKHRLSLESIFEAASTIDPLFSNSPQYQSETLSQTLGCELTLKLETSNPIRSFKGRGADYFLARAIARGETKAIVCASAGNFGQAMAYVCRKRGIELIVYASEQANPLKVERMRALGADVVLKGEDFDAAKSAARRYAAEAGAWMVEDGREPEISEGAGTIAVELLARDDVYDAVTVPLGNGALLNGMARWLKASSPATDTYGVSSAGADAMEKSWRAGSTVERSSVNTIADGLAVRVPIAEAVNDMRGLVDDILLVDDEAIVEAMRLLYRHAALMIEPAGAAGVAAIVANPDRFRGLRIATVLCGSNLTNDQIDRWLTGSGREP